MDTTTELKPSSRRRKQPTAVSAPPRLIEVPSIDEPIPVARKYGQSGPPLDLTLADLNPKETKVLVFLNGEANGPKRKIVSISDMAKALFKYKSKKVGESWVRNALRRLVRASLVEKDDPGFYMITFHARDLLSALDQD
jgi:hypothetical protein